jgi:hypothetical protein
MRLPRRPMATAVGVIVTFLLAPLAVTSTAAAAPPTAGRQPEIREIAPHKTYRLDPELQSQMTTQSPSIAARSEAPTTKAAAAGTTPPVGTVRPWLAIDDQKGELYGKNYTLRAVGSKIEVWVASGTDGTSTGTAFPAGDCRSAVAGSTDITDAQAKALVDEFDKTMYPKESAAFSVPPARDGSKAVLEGDFTGAGDKIVTLVDNVRDSNFYDFPARPTYIAGFFSSQFNELLDRNVMTIDAFDWKHRTGANPPDEPTSDLCTSRPARPRSYEGVFAHEYQHLLQYYTDPAEVNFVNEGLSDYAISLVGYGHTLASVNEKGADSHLYCFNGFGTVQTPYNPNPRDCGGPQNSLTRWGDEGPGNEILADYGNAWSFMLYLADHYGAKFLTDLHRDGKAQGLPAVQALLDKYAKGTKVADVIHNYQVMNLVDKAVDAKGVVVGVPKAKVTTKSLNAALNLDNPASYRIPGAAPNGADYVKLRSGATALSGKQLKSLQFTGAKTLPPLPLAWTVVSDAPGNAGNPALWSGNSSNLDVAAVTEVTVPTSGATLTFKEKHLAEEGYDYAYTTVSTDGGKTYTPLANANTVAGPLGPALNGDAENFVTQTFDLSTYAGKKVLVGFRYVSDGGINDGGWYVDDVAVGGTAVSDGSSLAPFKSPSQILPTPVANWNVRLVGLDEKKHAALVLPFNGKSSISLGALPLKVFSPFPTVVAIVSYDDPTEQVQQFAPYTLTVNGALQPGGTTPAD